MTQPSFIWSTSSSTAGCTVTDEPVRLRYGLGSLTLMLLDAFYDVTVEKDEGATLDEVAEALALRLSSSPGMKGHVIEQYVTARRYARVRVGKVWTEAETAQASTFPLAVRRYTSVTLNWLTRRGYMVRVGKQWYRTDKTVYQYNGRRVPVIYSRDQSERSRTKTVGEHREQGLMMAADRITAGMSGDELGELLAKIVDRSYRRKDKNGNWSSRLEEGRQAVSVGVKGKFLLKGRGVDPVLDNYLIRMICAQIDEKANPL